jgi:hypothetical protein
MSADASSSVSCAMIFVFVYCYFERLAVSCQSLILLRVTKQSTLNR